MNTPVISFKDVCAGYGRAEVLHNISFDITPHSFVGVVGPNGGGKTTLLKLMLGSLKPARGTVRVFGNTPEQTRLRIGYVMQHLQFDPSFPATVMDIALMGRAGHHRFGPYHADDRQAAVRALELTGMADLADQSFSELSGGQEQRTLIAQALACEPEILLLDEPTANIDSEGEQTIHRLLTDLKERMTIVTVSHNVNTVVSSVTHVLCVNRAASLQPVSDLHLETLTSADGLEKLMLHHGLTCHVFDPSRSIAQPHGAEENRLTPGADNAIIP